MRPQQLSLPRWAGPYVLYGLIGFGAAAWLENRAVFWMGVIAVAWLLLFRKWPLFTVNATATFMLLVIACFGGGRRGRW